MRAPAFWHQPAGFRSTVLLPISWVWRWATARRLKNGPWRKLDVPVICVGNINIGGTGKTPTVIALVERLIARGLKPAVVSRGHGGSEIGPLKVDERIHTAAEVGDEPLLLSAFCDTWVAKDREAGGLAAVAGGAEVIVLDDGFQNPGVSKDISIVVVDGAVGYGNGCVVPAGPLREPVDSGLERADVMLVIGPELDGSYPVPTIAGRIEVLPTGMDWNGLKVLAFAGIGRPEKFFGTLRSLDADVVNAEALADHQPLSDRLLKRLSAEAKSLGAQLVTTEKDAVRLPKKYKPEVLTLPVRLRIDDWKVIDGLLDRTFD